MGTLFGLISVFLMSSMPIVNKFILQTTSPLFGALMNAVISTAFFFAMTWISSKSIHVSMNRSCLLSGFFNGLGLVFMYMSLEQIHPAVMGFIGRLSLIYAMVLSSVFLKQKPDKAEIILGILAVGGALGSAFDGWNNLNILSLVLALGSSLSFSIANLGLKFASNHNSDGHVLGSMNFISSIIITFYLLVSPESIRIPSSAMSWGLIFFGALSGSCFGFWFYLLSMKRLTYSRASLLRTTGPLFTALIAYPFFGLDFNKIQVASALILMISIIALTIHEKNKKAKNLAIISSK